MFASVAHAMGTAGAGQAGGADALMQFVPLIAMLAIFYFLLIRPQQKRAKQHHGNSPPRLCCERYVSPFQGREGREVGSFALPADMRSVDPGGRMSAFLHFMRGAFRAVWPHRGKQGPYA